MPLLLFNVVVPQVSSSWTFVSRAVWCHCSLATGEGRTWYRVKFHIFCMEDMFCMYGLPLFTSGELREKSWWVGIIGLNTRRFYLAHGRVQSRLVFR